MCKPVYADKIKEIFGNDSIHFMPGMLVPTS